MTSEEIIRLTIRHYELAESADLRGPAYRELVKIKEQLWTLTPPERRIGLEGLWRHEGSGGAAPAESSAFTALDVAETAAMCELEGTPLAPVAAYVRPARRCVECGSMVYGDSCTHCHEG